jgi:hypothetical protein
MNQHQQQQQHSPQPGAAAPPALSPAVAESPQPIVRVMRLYKPVMHMTPPAPQLRMPAAVNEEVNKGSETDFALSNFLLLPDSFGDIYLGEKFSAYVSVVNGAADTTFSPVQMSVKLQTTLASYDLADIRPNPNKKSGYTNALRPGELDDVVVEHPITAIGSHSLKVFVEYVDPVTGEQRTLKKFYKFTVLNALLVGSTALHLGNRYVVQCQITNFARSLIHIEDVTLLSHRDLTVIRTPVDSDMNNASRFDSFPSLGPDEKYAEGFILEKPAGFMASSLGMIEVKWSTAMGEHGFVRGEELMAPAATPALEATGEKGKCIAVVSRLPAPLPPVPVAAAVDSPVRSNNIYRNLGAPGRGTRRNSRANSAAGHQQIMHSLSLHCLSCPDTAVSGKEFEIKFRVFNDNFTSPANIHLRCSNPCHSGEGGLGLLVVGKTSWSIGVLPPREFVDISVHVVAMSSGLHEFGGLYFTDLDAGALEYCSGSAIAKIFISSSSSISSTNTY